MAGRSMRTSMRTVALVVAAAVLLSGCRLVSRVMSPDTVRPIVTCSGLRLGPGVSGWVRVADLDTAAGVILARVTALGAPNASVSTNQPDQLVLGLPAGDDATWRAAALRPGRMVFLPVPPEFDEQVVDGLPLPAAMDVAPILTEAAIETAAVVEGGFGEPVVSITMTPEGAIAFDTWAADNVGRRFAMVIDGVVASAPLIRETRFNGQAQISGDFTVAEVQELAAMLDSGSLPGAVTEVASAPAQDGACQPDLIVP